MAPDAPICAAVVVAAGSGRRFGAGTGVPKQFLPLAGRPLLAWSVAAFADHPSVAEIVVVVPPATKREPPAWLDSLDVELVAGGAERFDSVRSGLDAIVGDPDIVLIHDGARPVIRPELIDRVIAATAETGAAIPGISVRDTLKKVSPADYVVSTIDRDGIFRVQTPQGFMFGELQQIHRRVEELDLAPTDDAALFEQFGRPVRVVAGDPENLKVTVPADLAYVAHLLSGGDGSERRGDEGR